MISKHHASSLCDAGGLFIRLAYPGVAANFKDLARHTTAPGISGMLILIMNDSLRESRK
jgi:hypothetical protein